MGEARTKHRPVFLFILAASLAAYFPALKAGFVFDDRSLVIENAGIRRLSEVPGLFLHNVHRYSPMRKTHYYRPLQAATYAADHAVWKLRPFGYHLTNVVLHAGTAFLLYVLLAALAFPFSAAVLAALFFALHPVHVSAVAYVSGRADLLVTLFLLAGCLAFVRHLRGQGKGMLFAAHAAFLAALLSRENALLGPLLFLAAGWASGARFGRALRDSAGFVAMAGTYAALRAYFSGPSAIVSAGMPDIPNLLNVLREYAALLVRPWPLYPMHATPRVAALSLPDAVFALSAALLFVACFLADRSRASRRLSFAALWTAIAFLPLPGLIHAFPRLGVLMAESWLYLPGAGLAALAGAACARLGLAGLAAGTAAIACGAAVLFAACGAWKDEVTLYRHALRFAPHNPNVRLNLAGALFDRGDADDASRLLEEALARDPDEWDAYLLLGNMRMAQGDAAAAEAAFRRAAQLRPAAARAWSNLGVALSTGGKKEEARAVLVKASKMDPAIWQTWRALGDLALDEGDFAAAAAAYARMSALGPSDSDGEARYGIALGSLGRTADAEKAFRRALRIDPESFDALKNLGVTYANAGKRREAALSWRKALEIAPDDAETRRYYEENADAIPA